MFSSYIPAMSKITVTFVCSILSSVLLSVSNTVDWNMLKEPQILDHGVLQFYFFLLKHLTHFIS